MIRSGNLNKRITIQQVAETKTSSGASLETWTTFDRPYASIEPLVGREGFNSEQVQGEYTVRFRIRYQAGINSKMRVLYDGVIYDIAPPINPRQANDELLLMAVVHVD